MGAFDVLGYVAEYAQEYLAGLDRRPVRAEADRVSGEGV